MIFGSRFGILCSNMLRDGERSCDVCYREISKEDRYIHRKILKEDLPPVLKAVDDILAVDAHGNIDVDR